MGIIKGGFLRMTGTLLRFLEFCCAGFIVGVYSYYLATLVHHNISIAAWIEAVEGISGLATVYAICGFLFTCCLGGTRFFAWLAIILDILFVGAFIAVAYYTRFGADGCNGYVNSPVGAGQPGNRSYGLGHSSNYNGPSLSTICRLDTACFSFAVAACAFFALTALFQFLMMRNHQNEKNNTFGHKSSRFGRKDVEATGAAGTSRSWVPFRRSHDSGVTGSTMQGQQYKEAPNTM